MTVDQGNLLLRFINEFPIIKLTILTNTNLI